MVHKDCISKCWQFVTAALTRLLCGKRRWLKRSLLIIFLLIIVSAILVNHYNTVITKTFEARTTLEPARVYAQPLPLYVGKKLTLNALLTQLKVQGYQRANASQIKEKVSGGYYSISGNDMVLSIRGFQFSDGWKDPIIVNLTIADNEIISLTDTTGRSISLVNLEPEMIGSLFPLANENRIPIALRDTPSLLVTTLLATEDRNYFNEWAISFKGIARAMLADIKAGHIVEGGSTLTQQLVKNFFLSNKRTFRRKVEEVIMAFLLEYHYSKNQILEAYINEVYLGQNGGQAIHGFELASEFYFARPLNELALSDIALLVGMVKGPSYYNPRRYPQRALTRRNLVLDLLAQQNVITQAVADKAKAMPLGVTTTQQVKNKSVPAYIDLVKKQILKEYIHKPNQNAGLIC